jgi:hypothetical protein
MLKNYNPTYFCFKAKTKKPPPLSTFAFSSSSQGLAAIT